MSMLFPSELTSQVHIDREQQIKTESGGIASVWTQVATAWVRIRPMSVVEQKRYSVDRTVYDHHLYAMATTDIRNGDRIRYGTRTFGDTSVMNVDELNEYLKIIVREIA
ncbi:MAG: head-tail adaptor protein [Planctomycetota bacterium]|nr:head-tail adaptor protein [Planctomycetota bacterium]